MYSTDPLLSTSVGGTPLVQLNKVVPDGCGTVWLKLESGNPTGSYKDRMAVAVLGRAIERGEVKPGDRVVEYTGGSTGTALAFVAARLGLRFVADSSDAFSKEKLRSVVLTARTHHNLFARAVPYVPAQKPNLSIRWRMQPCAMKTRGRSHLEYCRQRAS